MTEFSILTLKDGELITEQSMIVDLLSLPSSDPIAFAYGVSQGKYYSKTGMETKKIDHGANFRELAQEYLRGFLFGYTGILIPEGTRIKKGQEQNNYFHNLNQYGTNNRI